MIESAALHLFIQSIIKNKNENKNTQNHPSSMSFMSSFLCKVIRKKKSGKRTKKFSRAEDRTQNLLGCGKLTYTIRANHVRKRAEAFFM